MEQVYRLDLVQDRGWTRGPLHGAGLQAGLSTGETGPGALYMEQVYRLDLVQDRETGPGALYMKQVYRLDLVQGRLDQGPTT